MRPTKEEEKSNTKWGFEVDNSKKNSEMERPINPADALHLGHKKRSWRRLINREKSDSNMNELTTGKRKFNQELAIDSESYVEDVTKKAKIDNENSKVFTIIEPFWPIMNDGANSSQIISAAVKGAVDRK